MTLPEGALTVTALFDRLDRWRHLPAYQLERRADLFFSLYVSEVVGLHLECSLAPRLIPEFPLRKDHNNQSDKADYLLLAEDRSRAVLVELKTDMGSRNPAQDAYLQAAKQRGLRQHLYRILDIVGAASPEARGKYFHLLSALSELELLRLPAELSDRIYADRSHGLTKLLAQIEVLAPDAPLDVVYVQPRADGEKRTIGFDEFANIVVTHPDEMSQRFAQSLRDWARRDAGKPA